MGKTYNLVVFDWEGTVGEDTVGQVLNALSNEVQRMHYGTIDRKLGRQYAVLGLRQVIEKLLPDLPSHQHEQLLDDVQRALTTWTADTCLVPGSQSVIEAIHRQGMHLAIATNKGQASLQRVLRHSGLQSMFPVTRCAGQTPPKPCPQMLEEIMMEYQCSSDETLMVGDSVADIEMAKALNVDAIGVDFYNMQTEILKNAGAMMVIDDYQQLASLLLASK